MSDQKTSGAMEKTLDAVTSANIARWREALDDIIQTYPEFIAEGAPEATGENLNKLYDIRDELVNDITPWLVSIWVDEGIENEWNDVNIEAELKARKLIGEYSNPQSQNFLRSFLSEVEAKGKELRPEFKDSI